MFIPFSIFINYNSPFPWYFGPILQLLGLLFMFLTRFSFRFYKRLGKMSYAISALLRPIGILLIAWAWVEILSNSAPVNAWFSRIDVVVIFIWLLVLLILFYDSILKTFTIIMFIIAIAGGIVTFTLLANTPVAFMAGAIIAVIWSLWSISHLGFRRSFLYSKIEDPLVEDGPYLYQRHPQLLSAIVLAGCSIIVVNPIVGLGESLLIFGFCNLAIMIAGILLIIRFEEKDLILRLGHEYIDYKTRVPSLICFRRKSKGLSIKSALAISIPSYLASGAIVLLTLFGRGNFDINSLPIFLGFNANHDRASRITWWDMRHLAYQIDQVKQNGEYPEDLPPQVLKYWRDENRLVKHSIYPQTLFYCDKIYYSIEPGGVQKYKKKNIPVVAKLPFKLRCDANRKEIAQAMDYDGDGFPQVYLYYVDKDRNYRSDPVVAADDDSDKVNVELIENSRKSR